jgi:transcription initiation factor TFIIF subunit alpha
MAPRPSPSLLFHPKKPAKQEVQQASPPVRPKPTKLKDDDEEEVKLPEGPYQEFRLLSSALNGWKYDVMKFDSRRPVDIFRWSRPIKLNRKDLRREEVSNLAPEAVAPMLGLDGKPVIGSDGRTVMVDSEGRPIQNTSNGGAVGSSQDKGGKAKDKKRFTKKTRQVYFVPEEIRQLRREERYPWVMEDSSPSQNEVWNGQMEDASKSKTHAFFMPAANDVFKFVPAHRWYKFQKRLKHDLPTDSATMESLVFITPCNIRDLLIKFFVTQFNLTQKRDPQAWLATRNGGKGPSAATSAMFKAEAEGRTISIGSSLVHSSGQSLGPGGRKLKAVDSGANLFDDEDEDGNGKRQRERGLGEEGDLDEQVYEEDFADDEEKAEVDDNDEEAKELEVCKLFTTLTVF